MPPPDGGKLCYNSGDRREWEDVCTLNVVHCIVYIVYVVYMSNVNVNSELESISDHVLT